MLIRIKRTKKTLLLKTYLIYNAKRLLVCTVIISMQSRFQSVMHQLRMYWVNYSKQLMIKFYCRNLLIISIKILQFSKKKGSQRNSKFRKNPIVLKWTEMLMISLRTYFTVRLNLLSIWNKRLANHSFKIDILMRMTLRIFSLPKIKYSSFYKVKITLPMFKKRLKSVNLTLRSLQLWPSQKKINRL